MSFPKPARSTDQQLEILLQRGMHVADRERARHYLHHINYYRLRAYWLPFELTAPGDDGHYFKPGTDFDAVVALYDFDRELRLLLIDAIERIEISLRTRWANELSLRYGPFAHEEPAHFQKDYIWRQCKDELAKEYARSRETFAEHYRTRYNHLETPPIWVASELMTLGHLSRWLQNLRIPRDRQIIADAYGLDEKVLVSFAHHLTIVRNHCAHHGRVWNRKLSLKMQIPGKKPAGLSAMFNTAEPRRIYNTLAMLAYLLSRVSPESTWRRRLQDLIASAPQIDPAEMGFPAGWDRMAIWCEAVE